MDRPRDLTGRALQVLAPGPLCTVQDRGRPGAAALGIGAAGAADRASFALGQRLVGNSASAAALEVTLGGLRLQARGDLLIAVTGAPAPLSVRDQAQDEAQDEAPAGARGDAPGARAAPGNAPFYLLDGQELTLGLPGRGLRSYLAVRGGIDVPPVLGSRSADVLAGIGPPRLAAGDVVPVGTDVGEGPAADVAPVPDPPDSVVELRVVPGPRDDWFAADAVETLCAAPYEVTSDSDRVGMRLQGASLARARDGELPSEGMVPGALQVPPSGQPTLFLVDGPVTGGYPVIAVVVRADVDRAAQARPGQQLRFRAVRPAALR